MKRLKEIIDKLAGRFGRLTLLSRSRFFKERQIYHRSDNIVHFISLSPKTQIALSAVIGSALLWVSYASVNVVFKEQITVAKDRQHRIDVARLRLSTSYAQRAIEAYEQEKFLLAERLVEFCTLRGCDHQEFLETLIGNSDSEIEISCGVDNTFKLECDELTIRRITVREQKSIGSKINAFLEGSFKGVLVTVGQIMGIDGDPNDPEYIELLRSRLAQIWMPSLVAGALSILIFSLGLFLRIKDRPATAADLERLIAQIREQQPQLPKNSELE